MGKLFIFFVAIVSPLLADIKSELADGKDWAYQDLRINGETLWVGCGPNCPSRYEALRPLLDQFQRPFSVLEIGANNGYFSLRIAEEYPAFVVMIDGTNRLTKICEYNSQIHNVVYLQKFLTAEEIEKLAATEHFDVVLCFHVLHHVYCKRFVPDLFKLGDHVVIETPPENDGFVPEKPTIPEIARYLLSLPSGRQIGSFVRQSPEIRDHMILFSQPAHSVLDKRDFSHAEKYRAGIWQPIPMSISWLTYQRFNGVYPAVNKDSAENVLRYNSEYKNQ